MTSSESGLLSPSDASLSERRTCPARDRGTALVALLAAVVREASPDTSPRHGAAIHDAERAYRHHRDAGRDRSERRFGAGRDTARTTRADTLMATRNSMPPISGHGAPTVVNVTASDKTETPEGPGLPPWAFAYFGGHALYAVAASLAQIFTGER